MPELGARWSSRSRPPWRARRGNSATRAALAEPGGPRLSFRELHERAAAVARALIAAGSGPGDRVAIWAPNRHRWVLTALGALGAGAALVPVSTRFTGPEALDVISRSGARALFVAGAFLGVDRLARSCAAPAADRADAGSTGPAGAGRRRRRAGSEWDASGRAAGSLAAGPAAAPRRRRCARRTSATSCSPRAPPGGARAR